MALGLDGTAHSGSCVGLFATVQADVHRDQAEPSSGQTPDPS